MINSVEIAPWGGSEGEAWSFEARGGGLTSIIIRHGDAVDSVSFVAQWTDGRLQHSPHFGGPGGEESEIELDWPREYLTAISGTHGDFYDVPDAITSLEFTTNLGRKIGPYGQEHGTAFALTLKRGAIVGFHGRGGEYVLNSIGIIARP